MRLLDDPGQLARLAGPRLAYAVGVFDGVHAGHRAILRRLADEARAAGLAPCAVTFTGHPRAMLDPDAVPPRLTAPEAKRALLADAGAEFVLELPFDRHLAALTPAGFVELLGADGHGGLYVVGDNFRFGAHRAGTPRELARLVAARGGRVLVEPPAFLDGERVSSTRVRALVGAGRAAAAARLLGRPYTLAGLVVGGERVGRGIGWPTLNLAGWQTMLPAAGVYAADVETGGGTWRAMSYVGTRPTLGGTRTVVESHLFGYTGGARDGDPLAVRFRRWLRGDRRFSGLAELAAALELDREAALAERGDDEPGPRPAGA